MNVLQVITGLHKGGAEAHLLVLAKGLQALGVTCEVAFLRSTVLGGSVDLRDAFEEAGIPTHYLACERAYDLRFGVRLKRLLATRKWDILHSHLPRADAAAAACKCLDRDQVWISTLHDPYDGAYSGARLIPLVAPMWRLADGIIAVSEPVRRWSIERLGVSADAVKTIAHGIEIRPRQSVARGPDRSSGRSGFRIGAIGRYEERKGHETLIRAMVTIVKQFPEAELWIAGHDPAGHGDVLRRMVAELGLEAHVHLIGFLSDKETFFSQIDVFALASLWEGFGIVILEAMEAEKPSVVSDISPLREIICPGRSGLVAAREDPESFANAIMSLFRNRTYLQEIAQEGRRRVEAEFSHTRMIERTLQYYRDAAHNSLSSRRSSSWSSAHP